MGLVKGKTGAASPLAQQPSILHAIPISSSVFGQAITLLYGRNRVPGMLIDYQDFLPIAHNSTQKVGGKGGLGGGGSKNSISQTSYTYTAAVVIALCEGPILGLRNVYDSKGKLSLLSTTQPVTITGSTHTPSIPGGGHYEGDSGVGVDTAYSQSVNDFGSDGLRTLSGTYRVPFTRVNSVTAAGQYSVDPSTGIYTFHAADIGKVAQITYVYSVPDSTGTSGAPPTRLSLSVFTGQRPQTPWGTMTTKHPERALSYAGLAYIADAAMDLGSSGTLPNYNYEVVGLFPFGAGIEDANPRDIINDIVTSPLHGANQQNFLGDLTAYSNYCVANGIFLSPVIDTQTQVASFIDQIMTLTNSAVVQSEGKLKIIPYGDQSAAAFGTIYVPNTTPIYDLATADFLDTGGVDPVSFATSGSAGSNPLTNVYTLEVLDRNNNYNPVPIEDRDEASIQIYGVRPNQILSAHEICDTGIAATVAMALNRRAVNIRTNYKFQLPVKYCLLEPMDLVTLTDPIIGVKVPVRLTSIDEDADGNLSCEAEVFPWGTATPTLYSKEAANSISLQSGVDPGLAGAPIIFEAPTALSSSGLHELWISIAGAALVNQLIKSEQFDDAAWVKETGVTVTANSTTDPNGGTAADTITTTVGGNGVVQTSSVNATSGFPEIFSVWLKATANTSVRLALARTGGTPDLESKDIVVTTAWQRYAIAHTGTWTGASAIQALIRPLAASSVFAFGGQLEPGGTANTYIQTTTAAVSQPNPNWGGCSIWYSYDGSTYTKVPAPILGPARMGVLTGSVAAGTADPDTTNYFPVDLTQSQGSLLNGTQADADRFATLCWCDGEFISYQNANLTSTFNYQVGRSVGGTVYTRRALYGSVQAAHSSGAQFVRLDGGVFKWAYDPDFIGKTISLKFTSFNTSGLLEQSTANVPAYTFQLLGVFNQDERVGLNLLDNPGFELNIAGTPTATNLSLGSPVGDNWTASAALPGNLSGYPYIGAQLLASSSPRSGTKCLVLTALTGVTIPPSAQGYNIPVIADKIAVIPGQRYTYGGYLRSDANAAMPANVFMAGRIDPIFYDAAGNFLQDALPTNAIDARAPATGAYAINGNYITVPAAIGGVAPAFLALACCFFIVNSTGSNLVTGTNIYLQVRFDDLYLTLQNSLGDDSSGKQGSSANIYTGSMTYSSTSSSITWNWNFIASRTDIHLSQQSYSSTQAVTGIPNPSTSYNFFPFIDEFASVVSMVATGGVGTPAWAHVGTSVAWAAEQTRSDHYPLTTSPMAASTAPVGGSGGGSGPGGIGGACLRHDALVREKTKGVIPVSQLEVGDWVHCPVAEDTPDGWAEVIGVDKEKIGLDWIHLHCNVGDWLAVTAGHPFTLLDGSGRRAAQLCIEDAIPCTTGATFPERIAAYSYHAPKVMVSIRSQAHTYYAGMKAPVILQHNSQLAIS